MISESIREKARKYLELVRQPEVKKIVKCLARMPIEVAGIYAIGCVFEIDNRTSASIAISYGTIRNCIDWIDARYFRTGRYWDNFAVPLNELRNKYFGKK